MRMDYSFKWYYIIFHSNIILIKIINRPIQSVTINFGMKMPSWFDIQSLDQNSPNTFDGIDETKAYSMIMII